MIDLGEHNSIEEYFTYDSSDESVKKISESVLNFLTILDRIVSEKLSEITEEYRKELALIYSFEVKGLIEEFQWIVKSIKKSEPANMYGWSDWVTTFNVFVKKVERVSLELNRLGVFQ